MQSSKGNQCWFCQFKNADDAEYVSEQLNGATLDGNTFIVEANQSGGMCHVFCPPTGG